MDKITFQNYRCFGSEEQTARLAPLTLLVGPNSTGKTSFLALIRALWDVAFREVVPNFREEPYDLGSFQDIVHQRGGRGGRAKSFIAGFEYKMQPRSHQKPGENVRFDATFANRSSGPFPVTRCFSDNDASFDISATEENEPETVRYRIGQVEREQPFGRIRPVRQHDGLLSFDFVFFQLLRSNNREESTEELPMRPGDLEILDEFRRKIRNYGRPITRRYGTRSRSPDLQIGAIRPFAGAPLRSYPSRTYDPLRLAQDAHGEYIPSYLANLSRRNPDEWQRLKGALEGFGHTSGLFDEISVRSFGKTDGDPFQVQVRKFGKRRKGPWRNMIDMGYGVSQALPVLTELLRSDAPTMFLMQQPEVHLHPSAQAALGSLFCSVAAEGRQLVIETHSDYIIDRVRMDVRDKTTGLKPEDVSILYFEPSDLDVKIHSIRIDQVGNVLDAPYSYGEFFMAETRRSIGL